MSDASDLSVVFELSRANDPADPYAFTFEPQTYTLRTEGGGRLVLEIDWGPKLMADLEAVRQPDRDPAVVQRLGQTLARFLERASWPAQSAQIAEAHEQGRRVLVTIRSNAAELYALPWELLTLPGGQHLGSLSRVLIRYERPETKTKDESPSPRPEGGRILLAWSAAAGAVPAAEHEAAVRQACVEAHPQGAQALQVLPNATVRGIAEALSAAQKDGRPFSVLHVLCHGGRKGQTFGLVLDGDARPATVGADTWRTMLARVAGSLRLVLLAACDGGNAGEPGNHLGSVAQAIHVAGLEAVVASRYPLSRAGSTAMVEALYRGLLVEYGSLEHALLQARERLALDPNRLDWAALQLYARADDGEDTRPFVFRPYRGLLSFDAAQSRFFFGREAERAEAVGDLDALVRAGKPRLLVVAGASGTGKSSLIHSGAVPDIMAARDGTWVEVAMRPGSDPHANLDAALATRQDESRPLLLVVDQFEEIFTHTEDRKTRVAFARRLWSLAQGDSGVHCIIGLRVDFMGRCGELLLDDEGTRLDAVAYDEAHRIFVAQMAPEQLLEAIARPATLAGLQLQDGLAERIVAEVGMEPGALPLMQYTLDLMWQARRGRELCADVYDELGGIVGSLERRADELVEDLQDHEMQHARRMLTQLVGLGDDDTGDTRRRVPIEQLWPADAQEHAIAEAVLGRFVDERLLVRDDRTQGGATVEIAHEALIRCWDRLREWLHDERERRIGRYIVIERVRESGREEHYLAYDPQLDRRVTVKLLRVGRRGAEERARLRDQARALVRLSHPNTVATHDVGVAKGHVYIATELVEGTPLRKWREAEPRAWGEVVQMFIPVGEGLGAAHEIGLVHRAFSPDAVVIDGEQVPRIIDFSLDRRAKASDAGRSAGTIAARAKIRSTGSQPVLPQAAAAGKASPIIATMTESTVMVDSAYQPPERMRGQSMTAASDQFSFCVSLYEMLYGEHPFGGDALTAFVGALSSKPSTSSSRRTVIPERLRKVLLRGLAAGPDERWPSMEALCAELRGLVAPRRRKGKAPWLVGGGVVGLLAIGGGVAASLATGSDDDDAPPVQCTPGEEILAGVWDDERRAEVRGAIEAVDLPHAKGTRERVRAALDGYATAWAAKHDEICEATQVRQEQPRETMELREGCVLAGLAALRAEVEVLARADPSRVDRAADMVAALPALARCDDVEALEADRPSRGAMPTESLATPVRETLARARALRAVGDVSRASVAVDDAMKSIEGQDQPVLQAEARAVRGGLHADAGRLVEAERELEQAYELAAEHGHAAIEAEVVAALVQIVGRDPARSEAGLLWGKTALALARGRGEPRGLARALHAVAAVMRVAEKTTDAVEHHRQALAIEQEALGSEHPDLVRSHRALGLTHEAGEAYSAAFEQYEHALELSKKALGERHPRGAELLGDMARVLLAQGNSTGALEHYRRAMDILESPMGPSRALLAAPLLGVAGIELERKEHAAATEHAQSAIAILEAGASEPAQLARARFLLARASWHEAHRRREAIGLAERARDSLGNLGAAYETERAEIDQWLRDVGEPSGDAPPVAK